MTPLSPRFRPAGEESIIVEFDKKIDETVNRQVMALAKSLAEHPIRGVADTIPAYSTLMVCFRAEEIDEKNLVEELKKRLLQGADQDIDTGKIVEIPVCYGRYFGPDLKRVASLAGLTEEEVIALHTGRDYRIYMLGFLPGFPYLGGMDERLYTPRLAVPRTRIPAGSVGIGGAQTGIYPLDSPGGWQLIGRTPYEVYDPEREEPFLYQTGDRIRFVPISPEEYYDIRRRLVREKPAKKQEAVQDKMRKAPAGEGEQALPFLEILQPGPLSTIQDEGRMGYQSFGFSVSGAMDPYAFRNGNRLLRQSEGEASLEMTYLGIQARMHGEGRFVVTGAKTTITVNEEKRIENGEPFELTDGDVLRIGPAASGRLMYLAAKGGFDVPEVMKSRSTNLKCGIGGFRGRKLRAGDLLYLAGRESEEEEENPLPLQSVSFDADEKQELLLRVVPDPQEEMFTEEGIRCFYQETYLVTEESDRMGFRLEGPVVETRSGSDIVSEGIALGAIQIPASGKPIVLMADRQTTGGYAKIGVVKKEDLAKLAQSRPGRKVRFVRLNRQEEGKNL